MEAGRRVADVVPHRRRARREDRDVGAALALQLQLRLLQALADLVVADGDRAFRRRTQRIRQSRDLAVPIDLELVGRGRVVPVAVDDHRLIALSILSRSAIVGTTLAALDSGSRPSRMALTNSTS